MIGGLRIWGANGALQLDENSFTVRVVYSALITLQQTNAFISVPGVDPSSCIGVCLPNTAWSNSNSGQSAAVSQYDAQILSGGVIVWSRNRNMPNGRVGVSTQRLIILRYK